MALQGSFLSVYGTAFRASWRLRSVDLPGIVFPDVHRVGQCLRGLLADQVVVISFSFRALTL